MEKIVETRAIIAECLKRAEVFKTLGKSHLLKIAAFCSEETYQDGQGIFVEGKPADTMLVVERGKLAIEKKIQVGRRSTSRNATIAYVGPDQVAGFSTIASPHVHTASVIAIEPTRVLIIDGLKLRDYLASHPKAGYQALSALLALVRGRYRSATNTLTYFLSIVSHELRAPLAAIENYLRTMHGGFVGDLTPKQERMMKRSILRVTDLSALISDVVDLARMRPEQIQADFEWFDPAEVGRESIDDARLAASEKDININVVPPDEFEPLVGARRRMRQVFTNLLHNAIKFAPSNSVVTFRAWYEPEELIFEVEDQGPGIPPDELPHIFKDFYRGTNVKGSAGAGLGLSIAKKIMDAHQGNIVVKNIREENGDIKGTRFTVHIPRDLKTPEARRREWEREEKG
ncbi:MAG: Alkaline phosphatase synthesis sensor protein PhoR [Chloroflexi bacterium]|nr:Alkaline phosphatase synthesis sensor protein PhoR [Chloroflexota bacterium]